MATQIGKVMFTPKGSYSSSVSYVFLDTVLYNGSAWVWINQTSGSNITPTDSATTYWYKLVQGMADYIEVSDYPTASNVTMNKFYHKTGTAELKYTVQKGSEYEWASITDYNSLSNKPIFIYDELPTASADYWKQNAQVGGQLSVCMRSGTEGLYTYSWVDYLTASKIVTSGLLSTTESGFIPDAATLAGIIGSTSLTGIGDGTLSGAISQLNSDMTAHNINSDIFEIGTKKYIKIGKTVIVSIQMFSAQNQSLVANTTAILTGLPAPPANASFLLIRVPDNTSVLPLNPVTFGINMRPDGICYPANTETIPGWRQISGSFIYECA